MLSANEESREGFEELHPLLVSFPLAFWRMRLLVGRKAGTFPLKLLILSMIRESEGLHPKELRDRLGLEFSRLSRLTQSLEREGLLRRERDPKDGRFLRLRLTEDGHEFSKERTARANEEFQRHLEGLSPRKLEELDRMLGAVAEGMKL